jgi:hypothetical protein
LSGAVVAIEQHHYAVANYFELAALGYEHGGIFFEAEAAGVSGDNPGHAHNADPLNEMGINGYVAQQLPAGGEVNLVFEKARVHKYGFWPPL